jgi:hypothetical protein
MFDSLLSLLRSEGINDRVKKEIQVQIDAIEELLIGDLTDNLPEENLERVSDNHSQIIEQTLNQLQLQKQEKGGS